MVIQVLIGVGLFVIGFLVPILAYRIGYRMGKFDEKKRTKEIFKSRVKEEIAEVTALTRELQGKDTH